MVNIHKDNKSSFTFLQERDFDEWAFEAHIWKKDFFKKIALPFK